MSISIGWAEPHLITRQGYERLQDELRELSTRRRQEVAGWLHAAREDGADLTENADLAQAMDEQDLLERRIADLEAALAMATIAATTTDGTAGIGSRVRVVGARSEECVYTLVGPLEAHPRDGRISIASPVGQALIGRRVDDVVEIETPGGIRRLTILAVEAPSPSAENRRRLRTGRLPVR